MDNLSRFLSEIAWGLDEQAGALADDGASVAAPAVLALRDYADQLRAVAGAARRDVIAWSRIEDEIGVDLEPEPLPIIRIVFWPGDVEGMAEEAGVPPATAMSRAVGWRKAIEETATELCNVQLGSVVRSDRP